MIPKSFEVNMLIKLKKCERTELFHPKKMTIFVHLVEGKSVVESANKISKKD